MAKRVTSTVDPRLRFPEFRTAAGWHEAELRQFLKISATYGIVTAGEFQSVGIPMIRGGDIKDGQVGDGLPLVSAEVHSQYKRTTLRTNDIVIALVGYPGEAAVVPKRYIGANISRAVGLLRITDSIDSSYLTAYLNSSFGRATVLKPSAGSAQIVVNLKYLNVISIPVPAKAEQKKIADCLTSLDEVIAAQGRKVEALKTHKRGLMQQLFPREGETRPRLRFPEFRNVPEWRKVSIGDIGEVITGNTPATAQQEYYGGDRPFVSPADISDRRFVETTKTTLSEAGFHKSRSIRAMSVLFVCIGSTIGKVAQNTRECATNQQINAVVANSAFSSDFVYYLLHMEAVRIARLAGRQAVPIINKSLFSAVKVAAPRREEQQRIADCLSSLDTQIIAESNQLAVLKTHKQALMQQLFPVPEGIGA